MELEKPTSRSGMKAVRETDLSRQLRNLDAKYAFRIIRKFDH
jgi:hypothetical protein